VALSVAGNKKTMEWSSPQWHDTHCNFHEYPVDLEVTGVIKCMHM